jgi:general stress protein 26
MTTGKIDPRYGNASAAAPNWADIENRLTTAQLYWIVTVRSDGRPHAVPLVGVWQDGAFYFCTGNDEQKHRNLESNSRVAVLAGNLGAAGWNVGKDIALEGRAVRVTDPDHLKTLAAAWYEKFGDDWRWEVRSDAFYELSNSGDGTGNPAWVYQVAPAKVIVFGDEHGQTTFRF